MAKKRIPADDKPKLSKTDPTYYVSIGHVGGRATLKAKGKEFFSEIARLRHQRARDARSAAAGESQ